MNITQSEADELIAIEKYCEDDDIEWEYPITGGKLAIPLTTIDKKESFILDIYRGRIDLSKNTFQNRVRKAIILVRLDLGGRPHRNPDGVEIFSPHLHIYREGYGDKWAIEVPGEFFSDLSSINQTLNDFMVYCNVVVKPNISEGLFA